MKEFFFDSLARVSARERAAVLVPAIAHANGEELTRLAEHLAGTGRPEAIHALIRSWDRIDAARRPAIARVPAEPRPAIESLLAEGKPQSTARLIQFIDDRGDAQLAPLLGDLTAIGDGDLAASAANALLATVVKHLGHCGRWTADHSTRTALDQAVAAALDQFRAHRQRDVLLAAAIMSGRPGPRLRAILHDADHPGTVALRSVPQHIDDDLVRANLIQWIDHAVMHRPTMRWLDAARTARQWSDVLAAGGHLLLAPPRRRAVRRHPQPAKLLPPIAHAARMDSRAQSNLLDLLRACGLTTPRRVAYLSDLIALPSPLARMKAVGALRDLAAAGVDEAANTLGPWMRDGNTDVARYARRSLQHLRMILPATAEVDGGHHCAVWNDADADQRRRTIMRLAARDHVAAEQVLRQAIGMGDRARSVEAIAVVERLGFADRLVDELLAALDSEDSHIVATATRVLGRAARRSGDDRIRTRLTTLLRHENARVQANAVEALVAIRRGEQPAIDLASLIDAGDNRLRANALCALLARSQVGGAPNAAEAWRAMIEDDRPLHRISAIWVAGRHPRLAMLGELRRAADADHEPRPEIRTRAGAMARWVERHGQRPLMGSAT